MRKTFDLIAAPAGTEPGDYVPRVYAARNLPATSSATLEVQHGDAGWRVSLGWHCPDPVRDASGNTNLFVDAAALLAPTVADAQWITMGAPDKAVEGALWRADREELLRIRAEGLGTVKRQQPPNHWKAHSDWSEARWSVTFELASWPALDDHNQLAFAIWRGAAADRGGLKAIVPQWIAVEP